MPQPPPKTRLTNWYEVSPRLIPEKVCSRCKIPEYMGTFKSCVRGSFIREGSRPGMTKEELKGLKSVPVKGNHDWVETRRKVPEPVLSSIKEFKINPLKRLVGFEIEASDFVDGKAISDYATKIGAGMCHDVAFEMNTPPMNGDAMVKKVTEISETIRKYGAVAYKGAGLHTHVDCRDASWNDIRKVCVLYGKTELALYSIIDPRRCTANSSQGGFCKMVGGERFAAMMDDPRTAKEDIISAVYGSVANMRKASSTNKNPAGGDRYLGLNLHSWFMRGTIEFRLHHGTTKASKMINWGMLMAGMVQTAIDKGDREIADWPAGKEGMLKYAPTDAVRQWVNERWDYFAAKRKNKKQPLFVDAMPNNPSQQSADYFTEE